MQSITSTSLETARAIGELCIGGDSACAHGDLSTLESIAHQLGDYSPEPLHCELIELADLCRRDPVTATSRWTQLKDLLYRSVT